MLTASWFTYRGPGRISISRGTPRQAAPGYRKYLALAPHREMLSMPRPEYERIFFGEILARLDPQQVWDDLHRLARTAAPGGREDDWQPVLLCYERPPFSPTNWCHRRMVASWFEEKLGVTVPEYERKMGDVNARQGGLF